MRGPHIRYPIAHSFIDCVFQRARPRINPTNFGAKQFHAENIQFLPTHVFHAHIDNAFEAEQGANGSSGNSVLSRTSFRNHAVLAHALDEKRLSQTVIDFVRAGM